MIKLHLTPSELDQIREVAPSLFRDLADCGNGDLMYFITQSMMDRVMTVLGLRS